MDAKEFLSQATVLNEKINMDFLHLQKLRQLLDRLGGGDLPQRLSSKSPIWKLK